MTDINFNLVVRATPEHIYERWQSDDGSYVIQRFSHEEVGACWPPMALRCQPYYAVYFHHSRLPGRHRNLDLAIRAAAAHQEAL